LAVRLTIACTGAAGSALSDHLAIPRRPVMLVVRHRKKMIAWVKRFFSTDTAPARKCCVQSAAKVQLPPDRRIAKVWIEDGCLICNACEATCPQVFKTLDDHAIVLAGSESSFVDCRDAIEQAAIGCCVAVIRVQYDDGSLAPIS